MPPLPSGTVPAYAEQVRAAVGAWWVAVQWLTPEEASGLLDHHNGNNRPLSESWKKLLDKIAGGVWQLNGDTIVFGANGHLLNGQHRLKAISKATGPVPVFAVYNVNPAVFVTFDQGKRRSGADVLSVLDFRNCTALSSAILWAQRYEAKDLDSPSSRTIPNEIIGDLAAAYPDLPASVHLTKGPWRLSKRFPSGLLAFLHYEFSRRNPEAAAAFFERVVDSVGLERDSHEFLLVRRLDGDMMGRRMTVDQIEIAALTIKTWNNIRLNKSPGQMIQWKRSAGERFPEIM